MYKWGQLQITKLNNWQIKAKHSESLRKYEELAKVCVCVYIGMANFKHFLKTALSP